MRKLDGKIALVTGASKGIGAGIAWSLAKEGAAVAVNYASDREGAGRVVEKIKAAGGKAIAVQGSVTSSVEIDRFFNETEKQLGKVDVLVNNAGVYVWLPLQDVNESSIYAATKGAVDSITRVLAKELGPRNIRVNSINPGVTDTEGARAMDAYDQIANAMKALTPLGRTGMPEDIGLIAAFLASDESRWLTGEIIFGSGGLR